MPDPEETSEDSTHLKALDAICEDMTQLLDAAKTLIEPEDKDLHEDPDIAPEMP